MKTRLLSALLVVGLLLSLFTQPVQAAGEAQFGDIEGRPDETAILQLHALGVINGYLDGDYHPATSSPGPSLP